MRLLYLFRAEIQGSNIKLSWVTNSSMEMEVGKTRLTILLLKITSNFPNHHTPCLWEGIVKGEKDSDVSVIGCHNSKETMLTISSSQIPHVTSLSLISGITYNDDLEDIVFHSSEDASRGERTKRQVNSDICGTVESRPIGLGFKSASTSSTPLPSKVVLNTNIRYDNSLLKYNGNSHKKTREWVDKVASRAKVLLKHESLNVKVILNYGNIEHIDETLQADEKTRDYLYRNHREKTLTSYFCDNNNDKQLGIAEISGACSTTGKAININERVEKGNPLFNTARVFAHEIGHNIGMYHDYDRSHGGSSSECNRKGLMSIGFYGTDVKRTPEKWTNCSNSDFSKFWRDGGNRSYKKAGQSCLKESKGGYEDYCGEHNRGKHYLVTTTGGKSYLIQC